MRFAGFCFGITAVYDITWTFWVPLMGITCTFGRQGGVEYFDLKLYIAEHYCNS